MRTSCQADDKMIKNYYEYLTEAELTREGEIKFSFTGGGLKSPKISFAALRNSDAEGSVEIELYSKGPVTYKYLADEELKAQISIVSGLTNSDEESKKSAIEKIEKIVKIKQQELNADFLQLFTQFDEQVKELLKKHNIQ